MLFSSPLSSYEKNKNTAQKMKKQGDRVSHLCGLAIYMKKYLNAKKKNYGNSNISPCKNHNLQKNPLKETKILQDTITL
jgi:NAD dependent epimerase/dehydratase family enzyme